MLRLSQTELDYTASLKARGFSIVEDGSAVIVIGKASEIPIDRAIGAFDLRSTTRARRFDSAKAAARTLIGELRCSD
jgi:hypothetical protein